MKSLVRRMKLLWEQWQERRAFTPQERRENEAWALILDVEAERDKLRADLDGVVNVDVCHACGFEGPCSYDVYANGDVSIDVYAFCVDELACVAMRKAPPQATTMDRDMVRASRKHWGSSQGCKACGTEDTGRFLKGGTLGYCDDCNEPPYDDDMPF